MNAAVWRLNAAAIAMALLSVGAQPAMADSPAAPKAETQATVTRLGFGISRITLPAKAARRLDIKTAEIRDDPSGLDGDAWVYTVPAPLSFVREGVVIERITGHYAYLQEGPPVGTQVVTVGVPELYGTEVGVNGE